MKKLLFILLCLPFIGFGQQTYVPDNNFENALINLGLDNVLDSTVTTSAIDTVTNLFIMSLNISDLTGIEGFTALENLSCSNNQLNSLDLSQNTALQSLNCPNNQLTSLDVSNNTALLELECRNNQLTSLDVSNNTALLELDCQSNQLTSLDVSANTALTELYCDANQLTSLDVSNNTALLELDCRSNQLTSLDVSQNTSLTYLNCGYNQLTSLDVSQNIALIQLNCGYNQLTSLDVSQNVALIQLNCSWGNYITTLNISQNLALEYLSCMGNLLTTLDVTQNLNLVNLTCYYNQITFLDLSQNIDLTYLHCGHNPLGSLDLSNNINLTTLICFNNDLTNINLVNNIALTFLSCGNIVNNTWSNYYNQFTSLDISQNTALQSLNCPNNQLTSLDVSNNTALTRFYVSNNPNLYCIDVDDVDWADTNWTVANGSIDSTMYFSTNCSLGCTDSLACNYSLAAITDDGSCLYSSLDTIEVISCDNYLWLTNGLLYDTSGIYTEFLTASNGCDSVVSLDLTVLNSTDTTYSIDTSVCEGFGLNGYYYSISATFLQEFPITQCDTHFIELNLDIIGNTTKSYDTIAVEGSYLWNGFTLTESGNYVFSTTNVQGCDSLVNLNLTILALTSLQENSTKKELFRITDLFGRETAYRKNTPLFYIYDDGTVEKKIIID